MSKTTKAAIAASTSASNGAAPIKAPRLRQSASKPEPAPETVPQPTNQHIPARPGVCAEGGAPVYDEEGNFIIPEDWRETVAAMSEVERGHYESWQRRIKRDANDPTYPDQPPTPPGLSPYDRERYLHHVHEEAGKHRIALMDRLSPEQLLVEIRQGRRPSFDKTRQLLYTLVETRQRERTRSAYYWDKFDGFLRTAYAEVGFQIDALTHYLESLNKQAVETAERAHIIALGFDDNTLSVIQSACSGPIKIPVSAAPVLMRYLRASLLLERAKRRERLLHDFAWESLGDGEAVKWSEPDTITRFTQLFQEMLAAFPKTAEEWEQSGLTIDDLIDADRVDEPDSFSITIEAQE